MTKSQFMLKALRKAEREIGVPDGWWGTWRDVTNGTVRVSLAAGRSWRISCAGMTISRHDSRSFAISKARKL